MKNINQSKKEYVTKVFNQVFNKYDLMNDVMSFGAHRIWKRKLMDWMSPRMSHHLVDVASGTGDVAKAFLKDTNFSGKVSCVEPNKNMLQVGKRKLKNFNNVQWYCSHAEKLPFKNETFDIYVVSFGIRNFSNIKLALKESKRVLKTGGRFLCLEFSKVNNEILSEFYKKYSKIIPHIGKYIVGESEPYQYLVNSINDFYSQEELLMLIKSNGFENVEFRDLSGGIAAIHSGWKI
ncbi:MAG: bifunctional demethylmenaquinone methyltransferase/2-methoxy-6-polyprenyl-1,4-benzoquinol methylase UbiE [Pseudomonadota bacterium]|nr:bifunctional demethylmenaquinone methyltransferase/2-methoxy-6-polyprenyl-1,4-benzoquinol methylase UbiE [Pseudomonadota bacterium]